MKGLLIAYSFSPQKNVGALRPTYWAEEISKYSNIKLDVLTAAPSEEENVNYKRFYIENKASSFWSMIIKDEGLTWRKDIIKFLQTHDVNQYDFVLISGGPFFHFSLGKFFKKFDIKVIYDFRDPFSHNPRINDNGVKRWIKVRYERNFLKNADLVLTVNDACHQYIGSGINVARAVIPNGFDERLITPELKNIKVKFDVFYGGKFYWEPVNFFDALQSEKLDLYHAGIHQNYPHLFTKGSSFHALGMLSQQEMFSVLAESEIGVVFTNNVPFESTTKIYDYLALGKKILIITKGEPHVGVLNRELENYPFYRWVHDDVNEIVKAIRVLKALETTKVTIDRFSRHSSLLLLITEIEKLVDGKNH